MFTFTQRGVNFSVYRYFKRRIHISQKTLLDHRNRRKYLSQMCLYPPSKLKDEGFNCKSQDLFLYNEMLFPCHMGAFYYLPLLLRSLEKLIRLIDEEMQDIGGQKIAMPTMVKSALWKKTGRWETAELLKLKDRHGKEYCLGPTHEELVTDLVAQFGNIPYKRLPIMLYQITRKFRDEMHPKYGLLRGREFEMKDMYTFDQDEESARETYHLVCDSYCKIFERLGVQYVKVEGATGNIGGKLSHEFHLPANIGEDTLYLCNNCGHGSNAELVDPEKIAQDSVSCQKCKSPMTKTSGIEVGHAFLLGTKYSEVLNAQYVDSSQKKRIAEMGCFGLGVSRILQACVEVLCEDKKIRWPSLIAPYQVCIIPQMEGFGSEQFNLIADNLYYSLTRLPNLRHEVIIDDRIKNTVGKRIYQADTQGYPYIVVVGRKSIEDLHLLELLDMKAGTTEFLTKDQVIDKLSRIQTI